MEKLKERSCLPCGVSYVDPGRRLGCGICTTRCFLDAVLSPTKRTEYSFTGGQLRGKQR